MFGNKTIAISVGGMMCEHCAAHVQDALTKIEGVASAKVDLSNKKVAIKTKRDLSEEELRNAIEGAGYKFQGIVA